MTVTANGKEKERLFIIMQDNMPPFGGMVLTKTENEQIIREYKIPNGQSVDIEEAAMYMIDKNGKREKIAVYDRIKHEWIKQ